MSDTPETDAEKFYSEHHGYYVVFAEHAEDLERERDAYENALRRIYDLSIDGDEIWSDIEQISAIAHNAMNKH